MSNDIEEELKKFLYGTEEVKKHGKKKSKTVKKDGKKFYLNILADYDSGMRSDQICEKHGISKQLLYTRRKPLIDEGLLLFNHHGFGEATQKGRILLQKKDTVKSKRNGVSRRSVSSGDGYNKIHVHNLRVKFPLMFDRSSGFWVQDSDFSYAGKKKYYYHTLFTVVNNANVSIELVFDFVLNVSSADEFDRMFKSLLDDRIKKGIDFLEQNNIGVNYTKRKVVGIELAIQTPTDRHLDWKKLSGLKIDLNRIREKVFSDDPDQESFVKVDESHRQRETPDLKHGRNILELPENVVKILNDTESLHKLMTQGSLPGLTAIENAMLMLVQNITALQKPITKIENYITQEQKIEEIEKTINDVSYKEEPDLKCPFCSSSFSRKLLIGRDMNCPGCFAQLDLYFPNIRDESGRPK